MGKQTRCHCGHTPRYRRQHPESPTCLCGCHQTANTHPAYGPTPVQRQASQATGQVPPLYTGPYTRGPAPHVPTPYRQRLGWYTTGSK